MDAAEFLARVVPQTGNYLTISWPTGKGPWAVQSFSSLNGHAEASQLLAWAARKGIDAYHASAAFTVGVSTTTKTNRPIIQAERKQSNVHSLRALWVDADVARPGDGKDPTKVFADQTAAFDWLVAFVKATAMPPPNLVVNSGWGLHWYWLFETPLSGADWQPLAKALRDAIVAHGWTGDVAPVIDSARLLRPPGTWNYKDKANPRPVEVIDAFTADYYDNSLIETALAPWVGAKQAATGTHGGASIHSLGPRPAHIKPDDKGAGLNQAAHAGIEQPTYHYKLIAARCAQAKQSLVSQGKGESRSLWKLGHMTLLAHCADGDAYVHELSKGDPRYTEAETDAEWDRTKDEVASKGVGPTLCASFDSCRSGVCGSCPHFGRIKTPLVLGVDDNDLPLGFRRVVKGMSKAVEARNKDKDGSWDTILWGDVRDPVLDELAPGGHTLTFVYELDAPRHVTIRGLDAGEARSALLSSLERQGVSADRHSFVRIGDLIVAWINKLRVQRVTRTERLRPWGWSHDVNGNRIGCAIAGDFYRNDGTEEKVTGGDPKVAAMYRPTGTLANWKKAAALFEGGRADLQCIIGCSFGSPLMALAGDVRGMCINFWSQESGVGKSTAIRVGQAVWADYKMLQSMKDTPNHVMRSLSEPRFLVRYWDELRVRPSWQDDFVELVFTIPQGKERGRLHSDTTMRESGEWECILAFSSNRSVQDYLLARDDATDSGLTRVLEIMLPKTQTDFDASAGPVIKLCESNYGHAGRIYLKWLAQNIPLVQQKLNHLMTAFSVNLNVQQEERFFVAAMACILVGASIAKKLELFDFDIQGIHKTLVDAFLKAREQRTRTTLTGATGGINVEELIGTYAYDQADWRLRTREFNTPGNSNNMKLLGRPRNNVVRYHISENDKVMRISRSELTTWLRDRDYAAGTVIEQAKKDLNAIEHKRSLGGGTEYAGATVWVLDVPLTGALAGLLAPRPTMTNVPPGVAPNAQNTANPRYRPSPGARVAGNQARM